MWNWLHKLEELAERATPAALVTVVRCTGSTPAAPGAKMIVLGDGTLFGTIGGGHLEQLAVQDACACLVSGESKVFRYPLGATAGQCCGGVVETFVEALNAAPQLVLFGAGHVGQALCRVLVGTPFVVHAVDERDEWSSALPPEVRRHAVPWEEFVAQVSWSAERIYLGNSDH